ncbi:hypothetical protein Cgig2_031738 [Carnegiea gigantea]|uniref:Uncharacterized protein n=1 Tax=Carnegiea gigantea TaxID=171969 RepID=A0A9Q1KRN3_9CARY|nr:hypothetical protein Cgig2_031738 [Carnegiea gigantea]
MELQVSVDVIIGNLSLKKACQAGQAVHVGGLMRLDLVEASVQTIYVTVWASPNVSLHLGKIENADETLRKHAGVRLQAKLYSCELASIDTIGQLHVLVDVQIILFNLAKATSDFQPFLSTPFWHIKAYTQRFDLIHCFYVDTNAFFRLATNKNALVLIFCQPPISTDRFSEMESWTQREFKVTGTSWDVNSSDIAVAGLGWFSLGLKGQATLKLWTYDTVEVVLREPLVLDRAPFIERPGFWLPQAISDAIGNRSKAEAKEKQPPPPPNPKKKGIMFLPLQIGAEPENFCD